MAVAIVLPSLNLSAQTQGTDVIRYGDVRHPVYDKEGMVAFVECPGHRDWRTRSRRWWHSRRRCSCRRLRAGSSSGHVREISVAAGSCSFIPPLTEKPGRSITARSHRSVRRVTCFSICNGNVDVQRARFSHLSAGVPGTVAGLHLAHSRYGKLPWKRLLAPAIELARNASRSATTCLALCRGRAKGFSRDSSSLQYFFKEDGAAYLPGERLVQADLAWSLEQIAEHGPDAFYRGEIAKKIIAEMKKGDGLIDAESLATYQPIVRDPVRGTYRGYDIVSMPPSSSGGIHVIQMLNILERFPVREVWRGKRR